MKLMPVTLMVLVALVLLLGAGCTTQTPAPAQSAAVLTNLSGSAEAGDVPAHATGFAGCQEVFTDAYNSQENVTWSPLRGYRYAEVFLNCGNRSVVYTTYGLNIEDNPRDSAPDKILATISTNAIASQYNVPSALVNGPRIWVLDKMTFSAGTMVRDFDGLKARWSLYSKPEDKTDPYVGFTIHRDSVFTWNKGQHAYILDDPAGTSWVLKSYDLSHISEQELSSLDKKLNLPAGWRFRVVNLTEDLVEVPVNGTAWMMIDDLVGVWDKAQAGEGMNYSP